MSDQGYYVSEARQIELLRARLATAEDRLQDWLKAWERMQQGLTPYGFRAAGNETRAFLAPTPPVTFPSVITAREEGCPCGGIILPDGKCANGCAPARFAPREGDPCELCGAPQKLAPPHMSFTYAKHDCPAAPPVRPTCADHPGKECEGGLCAVSPPASPTAEQVNGGPLRADSKFYPGQAVTVRATPPPCATCKGGGCPDCVSSHSYESAPPCATCRGLKLVVANVPHGNGVRVGSVRCPACSSGIEAPKSVPVAEVAEDAKESDPYCELAASEIPDFGTQYDKHRCAKAHRDKPLPAPPDPVSKPIPPELIGARPPLEPPCETCGGSRWVPDNCAPGYSAACPRCRPPRKTSP